jgi:hypothetical protein
LNPPIVNYGLPWDTSKLQQEIVAGDQPIV